MEQLIKVMNYVEIKKTNLKECWDFVGRGVLSEKQEKILLEYNYGIKTPDGQFGYVGDYIVRDNNKYFVYNEKDFQKMMIKQDITNNMSKFNDLEVRQYKMCKKILETELENIKSDLKIFKQYPVRYDSTYSNKNVKYYIYIFKENDLGLYVMRRNIFKNISCNNKKHLIGNINDLFYPSSLILKYIDDLREQRNKIIFLLKDLNMDFAKGSFIFKWYWGELINLNLVKIDINNLINTTLEN